MYRSIVLNSHIKSIINRPSDARVDGGRGCGKMRPLGYAETPPYAPPDPPVSEFESPNTNRITSPTHEMLLLDAKLKRKAKIMRNGRMFRVSIV